MSRRWPGRSSPRSTQRRTGRPLGAARDTFLARVEVPEALSNSTAFLMHLVMQPHLAEAFRPLIASKLADDNAKRAAHVQALHRSGATQSCARSSQREELWPVEAGVAASTGQAPPQKPPALPAVALERACASRRAVLAPLTLNTGGGGSGGRRQRRPPDGEPPSGEDGNENEGAAAVCAT